MTPVRPGGKLGLEAGRIGLAAVDQTHGAIGGPGDGRLRKR